MRKKITATIITIGDELLIGQVIDTNSAFIAKEMNKTGVIIQRRIAVADKATEIVQALNEEIGKVNLILMTGGLGPTSDDITKQTLARYFKSKMVMNHESLQNIYHLYESIYHKKPAKVNLEQARVPAVCEVLVNRRGSAPCMIFEKDRTYIISMAGVPFEMEGIIMDLVPWLKSHFQLPKVIHQTLVTTGIGESELAAILFNFEKNLPRTTQLAYLPGPGGLRLRITSVVFNKDEETESKKLFTSLKRLAKDFLAKPNDIPPEIELGNLLKQSGQTVSTAESCTGGKIASLITSVAGASIYYPGSIISYANRIKEKELGVKKSTLKKFGAVSEQVVKEMISGLLKRMKTTYGIAVSGIMGPDGGSDEKPVGTVWIAVGNQKKIETRKIRLRFDRQRNIEGTAVQALYMMRNFIENQKNSEKR